MTLVATDAVDLRGLLHFSIHAKLSTLTHTTSVKLGVQRPSLLASTRASDETQCRLYQDLLVQV